MNDQPTEVQAAGGWPLILARIAAAMHARKAHPARTVVVVPYAQLMPEATRQWGRLQPDGFAPRFETTRNWASRLGAAPPGADDLSLDPARDRLVARSLIERAGLRPQRELLLEPLLEAAASLAPVAAAIPPTQRTEWATRQKIRACIGLDADAMRVESAVTQLAVVWAANSAYPTDVLFDARAAQALECVVLLQGFSADPLLQALLAHWGALAETLSLPAAFPAAVTGTLSLHAASDAEDEAQRAAACVLRHIEAGRQPVALAAVDRVLTRRVRAMLGALQVPVRDETGWKLSTTRAAASVMAALRACDERADADAVLDWLKNSPSEDGAQVQQLERDLRRAGARDWRSAVARFNHAAAPDDAARIWRDGVQARRAGMSGRFSLAQWLDRTRELLQAGGQWPALLADPAGAELVRVLRLQEGAPAELQNLPAAAQRMDLGELIAWAEQALESASYVPANAGGEPVVILPLSQLLGRPFASLVVAGCDEQRLPLSPEPPGPWTPQQREALGLPSREALARANRDAWAHALQVPQVDILWRESDDGGEALLPSALVRLLHTGPHNPGPGRAQDPRARREVLPVPTARPLPVGAALVPPTLSASAYADLRRCPYRFFAQRQLALGEVDEIDTELDKRDFGQWLHALLKIFHDALAAQPASDAGERRALLEQAASAATARQGLDAAEFLPFAAAWPRVRDGYLEWLQLFEATGARYEHGELDAEQALGRVTLKGRIDRTDRFDGGALMVLDYKTESLSVTKARVKHPTEDTQLLFYAALQDADHLRAAYINIGEKDGTTVVEQTDVVAARDLLVEGVISDMNRIAAGQPLPAYGEGAVCETCGVRGLCRKDSWS